MRWKASELDQVIDAINATGYGLTLGINSRIGDTIDHIVKRARFATERTVKVNTTATGGNASLPTLGK